MKLGMHLYELSRLRLALLLSLAIALLLSLTSAYRISLFPPSLEPRPLAMSAASTQVLVDSPKSVLLNLGYGSDQLNQMTDRALLLGNVMTSAPVRAFIAQRVGLPERLIQMSPPLTPQFPRPIADGSQNQRRVTDLLRSNNQYRINVKADPTIPMLDIYTEASRPQTAIALANGAVDGLRDYLAAVARSQNIPANDQVRLEQLGRAQGGSVTGGVNVEVAALVFVFAFVLACLTSLLLAPVVRGWRSAAAGDDRPGCTPSTNGRVTAEDATRQAIAGRGA